MNMLRGLATLVCFQGIGEAIVYLSDMPIPGPVIGMVLLFATLQFTGTETPEWLGETGHFMIRWLSLMFLPACTGLFFLPDITTDQWLPIIGAMFLGTLLTMAAAGYLMHRLMPDPDGDSQ
ncbi:MAG: CidA/LrgA family protein [Gammaproteobacteria bacterium]|nr:MAG: CidA/LrgA family protein [Gammaproteobacteria bacterium]